MSAQAGPRDIGFFLSGGSTNSNVFLSTGGPISNFMINPDGISGLWSNISERQVRYGFKDIRIIYVKNRHPTLTFKNMRVYWNVSDNRTTMQIGRSGVNGVENSTLSLASIAASENPVPPSMWGAVIAADTFRVIQDFNNINRPFGTALPVNFLTKRGVGVEDSSAAIFNQKIARITFNVKRKGTARGQVNCKIWNSSGQEKASLGSVNSSTLGVQGDGTPFANSPVVFTNQANQYAMQVGDVIGLEYPGAGIDENTGDSDDAIIMSDWDWSGDSEQANIGNSQYDVFGTDERAWAEDSGQWIIGESGGNTGPGQSELVYKAEIYGSETPGNPGDPCGVNPGPGDPGDPGNPPPPQSGFVIMQDYSDVNATTGYQIGSQGPNNPIRQAVRIDNSTAAILQAPIARIGFFMRRVGNPAGNVSCRIWSSVGVVKQTLGQISVTNLTNQSSQWTESTFTLQNNDIQMTTGDLVGVEFDSGNAQDHVLVAGWAWQQTADASAAAEGGEAAAATDKFGTRMIYANNGNFLYNWEIPGNSDSMRWDHPNPPINMEMTGYFMKSSPSSDTVSCKIRGGKHTDGESEAGCCYIPQFPCTGGQMEFQIECPHPNNHDCSISGTRGTALSLAQWHGYKVVVWNTGSSVNIEAYQDKGNNSGSSPINQWEKVFSHVDSTGSCGNIDNPLLRPKGSTSQCTFRIDSNSGTQGKWLSVVEIQPGGVQPGPGPGPGPPSQPPGAKDIPGTSIARWNGTVWASNDGGNSDLVYKAEKFAVISGPPGPGPPGVPGTPGAPAEDPIIIDPGTKRKPTSYDQGINFPPLGPGKYHALILERLIPPSASEIRQEIIEQQIVAEIDATTSPEQPTDPGQPPPVQPPVNPNPPPPPSQPPPPGQPPPPPSGQLGPYASTGKQLSASTRRAVRHYASGKPDDETIEKNTDNIDYQNYQCVYFVTMHAIEHDDTVSSKLGGTHMGTGWHDHGVSFNQGKTCLGTEPNHPDTNSCIKVGANIGSILEKRIGICTVWRRSNLHTELWTKLPGGSWIKQLENTGALGGFSPNQSGGQEAQLRIDGFQDGSDPTIDVAVVQEIA